MRVIKYNIDSAIIRENAGSQGMISQVLSGKRGLTRELSQIITEVGVINNNMDLGV